jgi:DNA-binding MarR family transcriptional regulator
VEDTPVEPMESPCVCATLRMATRAVARVYDQALEPFGLRTTQYSILARLDAEGPSPVGRLAARLAMDRTTLAREAQPLVRMGLVEQTRGADRRQRVISLTPAGRSRLASALPAWKDAQRLVRSRLGYDRTQGLLGELRGLLGAVRN